ncbi:MAG: hypothetical protein WC374_04005 [Phycisphaerae bacterium]|jgi:hypothetical protein
MLIDAFITLASFTAPYEVKMNPQSMLWMLPLAAAVAIIYKAIKLPRITALNFIKESVILFASIVLFIIATSAALWLVAWLAIE